MMKSLLDHRRQRPLAMRSIRIFALSIILDAVRFCVGRNIPWRCQLVTSTERSSFQAPGRAGRRRIDRGDMAEMARNLVYGFVLAPLLMLAACNDGDRDAARSDPLNGPPPDTNPQVEQDPTPQTGTGGAQQGTVPAN
jgi:hypothetical protein